MGDLGNIMIDHQGAGSGQWLCKDLKVSDIVGRGLVITENEDDQGLGNYGSSLIDGNGGQGILGGIIGRSHYIYTERK